MNGRPRTETEIEVLRYIRDTVRMRGYPPSQREIAAAVGWASASDANATLRTLEARGLLRLAPGIPRGITITDAGMVALTEPV